MNSGSRRRSRGSSLDKLTLASRVFLATLTHRRRYPLTAKALRSAILNVPYAKASGDLASYLVVTSAQIEQFLNIGWEYAERALALLRQTSQFPISSDGVRMIIDLRRRMEAVRYKAFDEVSAEIYHDPVYPVFQHLGQAFRNQVTGRQPFVLESLDVAVPVPSRVCDVGCGAGMLLGDMLVRQPKTRGCGVDISSTMLLHARRILLARGLDGRGTVLNADLRDLPVADGAFDFVIAMEVLEHLPNPMAGLEELVRVLSASGTLVTSIPVHDPAPTHLYVFGGVGEVEELHKEVGLSIKRQKVTEVAPGVPNVLTAATVR